MGNRRGPGGYHRVVKKSGARRAWFWIMVVCLAVVAYNVVNAVVLASEKADIHPACAEADILTPDEREEWCGEALSSTATTDVNVVFAVLFGLLALVSLIVWRTRDQYKESPGESVSDKQADQPEKSVVRVLKRFSDPLVIEQLGELDDKAWDMFNARFEPCNKTGHIIGMLVLPPVSLIVLRQWVPLAVYAVLAWVFFVVYIQLLLLAHVVLVSTLPYLIKGRNDQQALKLLAELKAFGYLERG